jgi:CPA2 family monovalent cation:H+ antiporter-2
VPDAHGLAARLAGDSIGLALALTVGKLAIFIALVLLVGTRVVPWALEQVARTGSRELFTLSVLALALGIAYGSAELFGVSFALGAFFAGAVLSESDFSHQAAADSLPLKDAFAVLFVSVGMLFDPMIVARDPLAVVAVVLVIVIGQSLAAFAIVLMFGYPVRTALIISASLAQIGEFSFILAGLGVVFGVFPSEGRDLVIAGALFSIILNPLAFVAVDPLANWLRGRARLLTWLERPHDRPAKTPEFGTGECLQGHAIIVGFGRVGGLIGEALKAQELSFVVIEEDRRRVEELRKRGIEAVPHGDAALKQKAADLIGHTRALPDQARAHAIRYVRSWRKLNDGKMANSLIAHHRHTFFRG